jgi:OOP family OmpA-OmpF porin
MTITKAAMNNFKALRLLTLLGLSPLLAASAMAQYNDSYYYWGFGAGRAHAKLNEPGIATDLLGASAGSNIISRDDRDTSYKIFGGYQFDRYLGVELGYFKLGTFSFTTATNASSTLTGVLRTEGANADLVGTFPISDSWALLGRAGVQFARTRGDFSSTGNLVVTNTSPSERNTSYKAGLGLQYQISPGVLLRGEAERYRVADATGYRNNVDVATVSLVFPIGRELKSRPHAYVAPAYVAPAPVVAQAAVEPPPAPIAVAPLPAPTRVSFTAESLFSFDKAVILPEGRAALDSFAKQTASAKFDVINVEGHTDRLGSTDYNQALSQRRADAVKAYLVNSAGMDAAKVNAVGKSESSPVTKPEDCKGTHASKALIECLQPDRRVDIEVLGTR